MEPPAKRMRILQSIGADEVDESNPDYIQRKKQNSEWLKSKFDAICAKYTAMPDMMTDEWDMRKGEIVVDRGHGRKWDKEYRKRLGRRTALDDSQLVDDLFVNDPEMEGWDDEDSDYDEKDELAPSQSPEPISRKPDTLRAKSAQDEEAPPVQAREQIDIPVPGTSANRALQATLAASTHPAADLTQLVQFPQTPAGEQARRAFEAQTAQAVQQAVASILSSLLPNAASLQPQQLSVFQSPTTPTTLAVDPPAVAPATTPNLCPLPPLLQVSEPPVAAQSSSIAVAQTSRKERRSFAIAVHIKPSRHDSTLEEVPLILENDLVQTEEEEEASEPSENHQTASVDAIDVEALIEQPPSHRGRRIRYVFTAEDDQYIVESKLVHKRKWGEIINSRAEWKNWPRRAFHNYWTNTLAKKAAKMNFTQRDGEIDQAKAVSSTKTQSLQKQGVQLQSSPTAARHLPTPDSLEEEDGDHKDEQPMFNNIEDTIASGGHFDDDERDLLSIYGDNRPMCDAQADSLGGDTEEDPTDEVQNIPETPYNLTQEDSIQKILQGTVTRENTVDRVAVSVEIERTQAEPKSTQDISVNSVASSSRIPAKTTTNTTSQHTPLMEKTTAIIFSSPTELARRSKTKPTIHYDVGSNAGEADIDFVSSELSSAQVHQCALCKQTFTTGAILRAHEKQPHPKEVLYRPSSPFPPATQFDPFAPDTQTDLVAPTTPLIKREPLDPPSNLMLFTPALKTPMSAPQLKGLHSSGAKSSGKLSRSAYNKVKASWARKGTPVPKKRASLKAVQKKRFWEEIDDESEDELAR